MTNQTLGIEVAAPHGIANKRSNHELREANQHMHDFLALLGHELCTPLSAIRNALRVLEMKGDDAATRDWVRGVVERQSGCISFIAQDLLDIARIEHGKMRLRKQTVDLGRTIQLAIDTVQVTIEERGHQLEFTAPKEPIILEADPGRLELIFTNLLNNATRYMEPGGRIWVTAEVQGDEVVVNFRDSGMGIEAEMVDHIFDPFWQAERSFDHTHEGLGIGLALVCELARLHGGSASVTSAGVGHGSEFTIRLPVSAC